MTLETSDVLTDPLDFMNVANDVEEKESVLQLPKAPGITEEDKHLLSTLGISIESLSHVTAGGYLKLTTSDEKFFNYGNDLAKNHDFFNKENLNIANDDLNDFQSGKDTYYFGRDISRIDVSNKTDKYGRYAISTFGKDGKVTSVEYITSPAIRLKMMQDFESMLEDSERVSDVKNAILNQDFAFLNFLFVNYGGKDKGDFGKIEGKKGSKLMGNPNLNEAVHQIFNEGGFPNLDFSTIDFIDYITYGYDNTQRMGYRIAVYDNQTKTKYIIFDGKACTWQDHLNIWDTNKAAWRNTYGGGN